MDNQNTTINQTVGSYVKGNMKANTIINITGNSLSTSSASTSSIEPYFRFNIPTPTRHFKGRRNTLEAVRDYFSNLAPHTDDCWKRIVAIVGKGGMGKTETAYKFAAEYKTTFPNVAWINAESESSALTSFLAFAKYLKIVSADRKEADLQLVKQVYLHLDEGDRGSVLFIFDNAIRLNPDEKEFGIMEYLPTDDLTHKRFPYVLITTQTHDWGRGINTFRVDELTEEESVDFFSSCFQVQPSECDHLFKELHKLLEGYPLVMNLAASQIDYTPKKNSVGRLKQEIQSYIGKLEKEQKKIVNEKMNRAWCTKYNKTLSNVWQLTLQRIQQEDDGHDALELLQLMSFLHAPIESRKVVEMLFRSSACPHLTEMESRVKELVRVLERFYTVRILKEDKNDEKDFSWTLGIHRLVQLVLRQQIDSSEGFRRVLFYIASQYKCYENSDINISALEEALLECQLSQRALPYVGILACHGIHSASEIVTTRKPDTKAAATIWRLYNLERGMTTLNENAIQVLQELVGLTKSEQERVEDRYFFGDITICLLALRKDFFFGCSSDRRLGYFHLDTLTGVEELIHDFILNGCFKPDLSCKASFCQDQRESTDTGLSSLTLQLSETFIRVNAPSSALTGDSVAATWFVLFGRLRHYEGDSKMSSFCWKFWKNTYEKFHSQDACLPKIAALRTSLWNGGLATELIQIFGYICRQFSHMQYCFFPWILYLMDCCIEGMDLRDERAQQVISKFCQMITEIETKYIYNYHLDLFQGDWNRFAIDLCSVWVKLFLMESEPPSHNNLIESLSRLKILNYMERSPKLGVMKTPFFRTLHIPSKYLQKYFPQFIQRFSFSKIKVIQSLVNICRRLIEDNKGSRAWNDDAI